MCKLDNPLVDSAHDLIVSQCILPAINSRIVLAPDNVCAPKVPNNRVKIIWDPDNLPQYQDLVCGSLVRIRETWSSSSPASISMLLQSTNDILVTVSGKHFPGPDFPL